MDRAKPILAQIKKDGEKLYLHTVGRDAHVTMSSLASMAVELVADMYSPIDSTPAMRTAEHLAGGRCPHCGNTAYFGIPPHKHNLSLLLNTR